MENSELNSSEQNPEVLMEGNSGDFDWEKTKRLNEEIEVSAMEEDEDEESLADSMVCDSASTLVASGLLSPSSTEDIVLFVNAGASRSMESDSGVTVLPDKFFQGGDTFQTEEFITEGDCSFIYRSARLGNFCYRIENLPPGDYFLDLHFVEIIHTLGPKGMRVFNVLMQDEKVLDHFDIFSVVGSNKPLQLVNARFSIKDDVVLLIRFEGIIGSPIVSGICIRRASKTLVPHHNHGYLVCKNCSTEIELPSAQKKARMKSITKYEKTIQELKDMLQKKADECYQSWMSWRSANEQLEKVRMDLDNKTFQTYSLGQALEKQADKLKDISCKYEHDQRSWTEAINRLEQKLKVMKQEHSQLSLEAHECADSIPDLNKMVFAVQALVKQCDDLKMKYYEEQTERKKLHNQLQEFKGNIRVFCRCRPLSKTEVVAGCTSVVDFDFAKDGELGVLGNGSTKRTFKFDRVYTPKDDQVDIFADAAPMVISVLDGYNVCIFAYGQTGTGKTFTMEGTQENRGVNYRTLEELFNVAKERAETYTYSISVSVLEVYNEQIRDLLATETSKKLEIKQASEGSHHIPGIVEAKVENIQEVWHVLQEGSRARAVGSNNVNEHSSRSHCMLCIMVRTKNLISGECTKSKLWLVDLAGSERLAKTDAQGDRLKEAQNINRSLSALGDVISALANKSSHIPYRNSKLTHLLQDSLGGDSKMLMFVQISPSDQDSSETQSSLNFATRVRGVELGPARKHIDTCELQKTKTMLEKARQESKSKDEALKRLEENLHKLESSKDESCSHLQQKVMDLEDQLKEQEQILSAAYQLKVNDLENKLREQMQQSESTSLDLQNKVNDLERKLREQEENRDSASLCHKINDLEDRIRDQENQVASTGESEHRILRDANSLLHGVSQGPSLVKENKKKSSRIGEVENNGVVAPTPAMKNKTKVSDTAAKGIPKVVRVATKPMAATAQRAVSRVQTSRDPGQSVKERDSKKRKWTR